VKIVGPLHHDQVSAYVRCGDLLLCPVPGRIEFAMMSPTKSLEALGAGVPVVGSIEVDEHRRILEEGGGGLAVPFRVDAFADAVVALLGDPDKRQRMAEAGRRFVRRFRTYPRLARYLESVLLALADRRPPAAIPHDPDDLPWDDATA
jgi:glycosyltransferase involved in cell wall biosynthesis